MNEVIMEQIFQVVERSVWRSTSVSELEDLGWCITSEDIEDELFELMRESDLDEDVAIETLLSERFTFLLQPQLRRESELLVSPHREMLDETISAYNLGVYNLCIPSLFSIVEAALMYLANDGDFKNIRYVSGLQCRADSSALHWSLRNKLYQIAKTTEELFKKISFDNASCDLVLNRHISVHGRREEIYTQKDCLKLFLLLSSIISCYEN